MYIYYKARKFEKRGDYRPYLRTAATRQIVKITSLLRVLNFFNHNVFSGQNGWNAMLWPNMALISDYMENK